MAGEVRLEPVTNKDLQLLHRLTADPSATGEFEWYGYADPNTWRRRWEENGLLGEDGGTLMVCVGGERVGFVSWRKRPTGRISFCWNVGIAIAPEARHQGYGAQSQRLLVRYLFAHTQVNRIEAGTEVGNIAEQRSLEQAGFTREGIMRGTAFQGGRWHDGVLYSILRSEVDLSNDTSRRDM
jgi:RimJ/RimL family protein N-acetyltransferase